MGRGGDTQGPLQGQVGRGRRWRRRLEVGGQRDLCRALAGRKSQVERGPAWLGPRGDSQLIAAALVARSPHPGLGARKSEPER